MKFITILFVLLLTACATAYQSHSFSGGYSSIQLNENSFVVAFVGNGYTSQETSSAYALLRSAEIAKMNGFQYFSIVDFDGDNITSPS